jgi:membrane-bound serine protease (ClpP class)
LNIPATLIFCLAIAASVIAVLSRHKKSGTEPINLTGLSAIAMTPLDPEGSILVRGEVWPARSQDGTAIAPNAAVKVVGATGHLLVVTHG